MHPFSLLVITTAALAASIPNRLMEDDTTSASPIRRSAEPGNIQLHKTVISDWADDVYVAPQPNRYQHLEPLFRHQGDVIRVPEDRDSPAIRVDPINVPMYAETHPSPSVERDIASVFTPRSEPELQPDALEGKVPTCISKSGKLHTQRTRSLSYDHDNKYNGMHCGQSVREALKSFKKCRPTTNWGNCKTCVRSGEQGLWRVAVKSERQDINNMEKKA